LIPTSAVDICHHDEINIWHFDHLIEQIISTITNADHADADTIIRAQHLGRWICEHGRANRGLLEKRASSLIGHVSSRISVADDWWLVVSGKPQASTSHHR
jgi:hypothetical protein